MTARHLPHFFDYSSEFSYANIERVKTVDDIEHPLIRNLMKFKDMHEIRLSYEADLPARTGLGTSSSFAVGILNAFYGLKGKRVDKRRLADEAIYVERVLCREAVTPLIISNQRKKEFNDSLMLFFTGFSRFSSEIQKETGKNLANKVKSLMEMKALVDQAEEILTTKGDLNEFGKLLDYTWNLKRGISDAVSTDSIDNIYQRAMKAGATGGKLLGAGGGGFLLFYVEKDKQENVLSELDDLLYVPFLFENEGTQVIYFKAEDYDVPEKYLK